MSNRFLIDATRLRDALMELRAVACDMRHELAYQGSEGILRPQLCPSRMRNGNVACSHTSARLLIREAWLLLEKSDYPDATAQREELARVDYEISILDHRRFDAETEGRTDLVAVHVADHRMLVGQIETLRLSAIAALDRAASDLN